MLIETVWWKEASPLQISFEYEQTCSDAVDALALLLLRWRCCSAAREKRRTESTFAHSLVCLRFLNALQEREQGGSSCVSLRHHFANSGIAIQSAVPMTTAGCGGCGGAVGGSMRSRCQRHSIHRLTHFEGLLRRLAGADGDEARPRHAAETLQMEPLQHRHGRHGVVLGGKTTAQLCQTRLTVREEVDADQETENIVD